MTDNMTATEFEQRTPTPDPALKQLGDALLGIWQVSGGAQGQIRYEWMEGGFFLIQYVNLGETRGIEVIGRTTGFGATEPSEDIKSRYYGGMGETFDYVYELEGNTLIIWGGEKGSPAYYKGTFSDDGDTLTGEWVWPGGGYQSSATRVK